MQITVNVKDGATNTEMARQLRFQANLLDGIDPKKAASNALTGTPAKGKKAKAEEEDEEETDEVDADDDADSDDDADADDADDDDDADSDDDADADDSDADDDADDDDADDDDDAPPAKPAKGKKGKTAKGPSMKDVNAALKKRAEKTSFAKAKVWLKKKFKVDSITDLKPSQYAAVIKQAKVLNAG